MAILDALKQGMNLLVTFVALFGAIYLALFIILIIVGVIANVVASGDVNVSGTYENATGGGQDGIAGAVYDTENSFTNAVDTLQDPITVILSLVVVGVLTAMFFPQGIFGNRGGNQGVM